MKLLVTGGAGFIGSCFIKYILDKYPDYKVINLDILTCASNLDNLKEVQGNRNYVFIRGNIHDKKLVGDIMPEIDCCINFAEESHIDRSIIGPEIFIYTNILGTQILLDQAKENGIMRFVQISTDEVYGISGNAGYFSEDTSLAPNSPYSATKASADMLVRAYYETYDMPVMITRCSDIYGPNQYPDKLIPLFINNALQDKPLPVYGNGLNIRDWLYVYDHCSAIDAVLHIGQEGQVYNIAGNNEKTDLEIAKIILNQLNKPETLVEFTNDKPERKYAIDSTKIRNQLGWKPETTFEEGIKKTINWYINNQEWIRSFESQKGAGMK